VRNAIKSVVPTKMAINPPLLLQCKTTKTGKST